MNHIAGNSIEVKWSCMDIVYNQCLEHKAEKKSSKKDERRWEKCLNKIEIISYKYSYQTWCISYALKIMTKHVFVSLKEQKLWIFPYVAILQIDQKVTYVYSWIFQFANILAVSVFIWSLNKLCFVSSLLISSISASVSLKSKILKFWSILSLNRFWNNLNTSLDVPVKNNLWICQELDVQKDSSYLLQIEPKFVVESYIFEDTWNLHSFVWMERIQTEELLERSCYELIDQHSNKLGCWRYQLHVSFLLHIISKEVILRRSGFEHRLGLVLWYYARTFGRSTISNASWSLVHSLPKFGHSLSLWLIFWNIIHQNGSQIFMMLCKNFSILLLVSFSS